MSYAGLKSFLDEWAFESASTEKILRALTDASLAQRVGPEDRTLGRIAWHIAFTIPEMMSRTGLVLPHLPKKPPARAEEIAAAYNSTSAAFVAALSSKWTDATLLVEDDMYGERWTRSATLASLVHHQVHHRGQMTVLMRQAGLRVPGIYGPAREEWAARGAPVPEV